MSLLALQLLNKTLLCWTTLTNSVWVIQKWEIPFFLVIILDLGMCGSPMCPFYQMLTLFWNVLDMFLEHLSCLIEGSSCYTGDTCNPLQVFLHLLFDHGILNTSCQGVSLRSWAFVGGHHWHLHPLSYPKLLEHTYQGLLLSPQRFLLDRKPVSMLYLLQYISIGLTGKIFITWIYCLWCIIVMNWIFCQCVRDCTHFNMMFWMASFSDCVVLCRFPV